eukprot:s793_g16.t1
MDSEVPAAEEQVWALEQQPRKEHGISCKVSHRKGRDAILFGTSDITAGWLNSGNWQLRLPLNWSCWALVELDFLPPAFSGRSFQSVESPQQILACASSILDPCHLRTSAGAPQRRNVDNFHAPTCAHLEDLRKDLGDLTPTGLTPMYCAARSQAEQLVKVQTCQQRPEQLSLGRLEAAAKDQFFMASVAATKRTCRLHSDTSHTSSLHQGQGLTTTSGYLVELQ